VTGRKEDEGGRKGGKKNKVCYGGESKGGEFFKRGKDERTHSQKGEDKGQKIKKKKSKRFV